MRHEDFIKGVKANGKQAAKTAETRSGSVEAGMFEQENYAKKMARNMIFGLVDMEIYGDTESYFYLALEETLGREPAEFEWEQLRDAVYKVLEEAGLGE